MWSDSKTVMVVPDLRPAGKLLPALQICTGLLLAALAAACVAPPPPPAKKAAEVQPTPSPAPTPTPAPEPTPVPVEERDDIVVLDSGGAKEGSSGQTLAEAARAERERRAHAEPSTHVITNKNLKEYASKGQITMATPRERKVEEAPPAQDEQYWRQRVLDIRLRWREAADEVKELEQAAAGWRRRFYAENDVYVRSGQIKPEWDRVLDRLEEARAEVEAAKTELAEVQDEGRAAGALPGWLREGIDQEPKEEPEPSREHKVIDPPVVDEDGNGR